MRACSLAARSRLLAGSTAVVAVCLARLCMFVDCVLARRQVSNYLLRTRLSLAKPQKKHKRPVLAPGSCKHKYVDRPTYAQSQNHSLASVVRLLDPISHSGFLTSPINRGAASNICEHCVCSSTRGGNPAT